MHIPEFDGLRAVACVLVMCFHAAPAGVFRGGFLGVDVFFVLSGYLISNILASDQDRHGRVQVGRFYMHRALRLVPALLLFLATYLVIAPIMWPGQPHLRDAGLAALYLSDYSYPLSGNPTFLRHTWSLAVEEQFYLLWPLLFPLIAGRKSSLPILLGVWLAMTLYRLSLSGEGWVSYYFPLHTHSSGIIAGAALAIAQRRRLLKFGGHLGVIAMAGLGIMAFIADITSSALTITVAELLSAIVIGSIAYGGNARPLLFLSSKAMIFIGKLSYGLYLWHFPIAYYSRTHYSGLVSTTATLTLSLVAAVASYLTVEAWGRAMKARLQASEPTGPDAKPPCATVSEAC